MSWDKLPEYTILDLACLAADYEPVEYPLNVQLNHLIKKHLRNLKLALFRDNPDFKKYVLEPKGSDEQTKRFFTQTLSREHAKKYLAELVGTPNLLTETDEPSQFPEIDPNHLMISDEFRIALQAWEAVLADSPPKPKRGSRKTLISEWLGCKHPNLSTSAKERIAVLLNPNSNGGTPPSGEK